MSLPGFWTSMRAENRGASMASQITDGQDRAERWII